MADVPIASPRSRRDEETQSPCYRRSGKSVTLFQGNREPLQAVHRQGKTLAVPKKNLEEAVALYLETCGDT